MAEDTVACRVRVHGRVTGVGFRYSALREARRHPDLYGYVRNADARTVECVVQGAPARVAEFVAWLRHGPSAARVTRCEIADMPVDPDRDAFRITY